MHLAPSQARQWILVTVVTQTHPTFAWPSTPTTTSPFNETEGEKDGGKRREQQSDHRERGGVGWGGCRWREQVVNITEQQELQLKIFTCVHRVNEQQCVISNSDTDSENHCNMRLLEHAPEQKVGISLACY